MSSSTPTTLKPSFKSGQAAARLKELGYAFNDAGELRKINKYTGEVGDEPFEYKVSEDPDKNQAHYEKIADQIPEVVYDLLEENGLSRNYIPEGAPPEESSFFFSYPEKLHKPKKLIVILHGSGYVRAGQWARRLIINNSLNHGTQIPYIKRARELGYDVVIMNTNENYRIINGKKKYIEGLKTPTEHASHVWEKYVMACQPDSVAVVAHSAGGGITFNLMQSYLDFFENHVFAIALTDSAHSYLPNNVRDVVAHKICNWISSNKPLGMEHSSSRDIKMVSAGHTEHEWTSYSAFESIFKYLEQKYADMALGEKNYSVKN